jgi:hypothetical protein
VFSDFTRTTVDQFSHSAFQLYATGGSSVPEPSSAVRVGICRSFNNLAIALMLSPCCVYASNIVRTISDSVSFTS